MPNNGTTEEQQMYEMLQDLWGRIESVDDVFDEVSGYMNGMRSAQSENEVLREALEACVDCLGDEFALPWDVICEARNALAKARGETDEGHGRRSDG